MKLIPIIDAGHGGMINGKYATAPKKMYKFLQDGFTFHEGVVNRLIAELLVVKLANAEIPFHTGCVYTQEDMPLRERVRVSNNIYETDKNTYTLSIHSNTMSATGEGYGEKAHGNEIWTSEGQTKSDSLAAIAAGIYKKRMPDMTFRMDLDQGDLVKDAPFYLLRKTHGPAFLVENGFYDNRKEADFLSSEEGQLAYADVLFEIVNTLYNG